MTTGLDRRLLKVLKGEAIWPPPIWMMRQAGRYLPEYRETRKQAGGFLDLCYSPKLATEVTLQPIRRFGFDAAILFSDILVIPHALGRRLDFVEGEGPQLDPIDLDQLAGLNSTETAIGRLQPVFEALSLIRASLPAETTLLGFCGAPWTLATYLIAGHGTPDQMPARLAAFRTPEKLDRLMDILVEVTIAYLVEQFRAGADAVQIFDSWAGTLDELSFERFAMEPVRRIVAGVRAVIPDAPIIGFPKGGGASLPAYIARTGVSAVGADWQVPLDYLRDHVQPLGAVQGNLDPLHLVTGGVGMDRAIDHILEKLGKGPLVFNLGHGITPSGQIDNVARMIARVRGAV